jgi:hypothetical protein
VRRGQDQIMAVVLCMGQPVTEPGEVVVVNQSGRPHRLPIRFPLSLDQSFSDRSRISSERFVY